MPSRRLVPRIVWAGCPGHVVRVDCSAGGDSTMTTSEARPAVTRPARQIDAASRAFVGTTLSLTAVAIAASFVMSFHAQAAIGAALGLPAYLQYVMAVTVDLWVAVSILSLATSRARGQGTRVPTTGIRRLVPGGQQIQQASIWAWTAASIALNITYALSTYDGSSLPMTVGAALVGAAFPVGIVVGSHTIQALLVAPPEEAPAAAARTRLANAGVPLAAVAHSGRSVRDQADDLRIADALTSNGSPSLRGVATQLGVSVHRVRTVRAALAAPAA